MLVYLLNNALEILFIVLACLLSWKAGEYRNHLGHYPALYVAIACCILSAVFLFDTGIPQ
jgi:hypothetical protein